MALSGSRLKVGSELFEYDKRLRLLIEKKAFYPWLMPYGFRKTKKGYKWFGPSLGEATIEAQSKALAQISKKSITADIAKQLLENIGEPTKFEQIISTVEKAEKSKNARKVTTFLKGGHLNKSDFKPVEAEESYRQRVELYFSFIRRHPEASGFVMQNPGFGNFRCPYKKIMANQLTGLTNLFGETKSACRVFLLKPEDQLNNKWYKKSSFFISMIASLVLSVTLAVSLKLSLADFSLWGAVGIGAAFFVICSLIIVCCTYSYGQCSEKELGAISQLCREQGNKHKKSWPKFFTPKFIYRYLYIKFPLAVARWQEGKDAAIVNSIKTMWGKLKERGIEKVVIVGVKVPGGSSLELFKQELKGWDFRLLSKKGELKKDASSKESSHDKADRSSKKSELYIIASK